MCTSDRHGSPTFAVHCLYMYYRKKRKIIVRVNELYIIGLYSHVRYTLDCVYATIKMISSVNAKALHSSVYVFSCTNQLLITNTVISCGDLLYFWLEQNICVFAFFCFSNFKIYTNICVYIIYTYHKINNKQLRRDKRIVVLSFKINKNIQI